MINALPKPLLVALIFILGVVGLFILQPPHRQCESQIEVLMQQQKGRVFSGEVKGHARKPKVLEQIETCKMGNSPGACFELFSTLRRLARDMSILPLECAADLAELGEIRLALKEGLGLLLQIAWGEAAPEKETGGRGQGWLEASDLALFCSLRDLYARLYGPESSDQLRTELLSKLPGEAPILKEGLCENCEYRKTAIAILGAEDVRTRSLFGIRCDLYR